MFTSQMGKLCFVVAMLEVLLRENSAYGSSIYVGRHEAGTYSEHKPSQSIYSEVPCVDANKRQCEKIINFYGAGVCNTNDESLMATLQSVCQDTCGFCAKCQDEFDFCTEYGQYCRDDEVGDLVREVCPKTCESCDLAPSKEQNNLVVIHGE